MIKPIMVRRKSKKDLVTCQQPIINFGIFMYVLQKKEPVGDESEPVPEAVTAQLGDLTREILDSHVSIQSNCKAKGQYSTQVQKLHTLQMVLGQLHPGQSPPDN